MTWAILKREEKKHCLKEGCPNFKNKENFQRSRDRIKTALQTGFSGHDTLVESRCSAGGISLLESSFKERRPSGSCCIAAPVSFAVHRPFKKVSW